MILDLQEMFSGAVAADGTKTAQGPITATQLSTNVLDLRNNALPTLADEGIMGGEIWLIVSVAQAFNNLTSLTITLESDSAPGLATTPAVHFSQTVALAALTASSTVVRVPLPSADFQRYLGVRYTVNGTAPSAGTVLAQLVLEPQRNKIYRSGFTIDV